MNMHSSIKPSAGLSLRNSEWDRIVADYWEAKAAYDRYNEQVYQPAHGELCRLTGPRPSLSFSVTARNGKIAHYEMFPAELDEWAESELFGRYAAPIRDVWRKWLAAKETAERDIGWAAIEERSNDLMGELIHAEDMLVDTPAPDAMAFTFKVAVAFADDCYREDWTEALASEAHKIAAHYVC